jgi:hypothetical protein
MTTRRLVLARVAAVVAGGLSPAAAKTGDWVVLGRREVRPGRDRDRIALSGEGRFDALRLAVAQNGIYVETMQVRFGNGAVLDFRLRTFIEKDTQSRGFDLPGEVRALRRIDLFYARRPGGGPAVVTVLGRRA